jgi:hypothetical protein
VADTITAIASLLWPILVVVGLLVFRSPLVHVVRSFERRKMTIDELSAQQTNQIADLQEQLGALHQAVEALAEAQSPPDLSRTNRSRCFGSTTIRRTTHCWWSSYNKTEFVST